MKRKTFHDLFKRTYDGYSYMCKKYPKAARKRRIRNKWRKRFGRGLTGIMEDSALYGTGLFKMMPKGNQWNGVVITPFETHKDKNE